MTRSKIKKGEALKARMTIKVDGRNVIIKGRKYIAKRTKGCCCHQAVDIGYRHYRPIVCTCSDCGKKKPSSKTIMLPSSYFLRKGEKSDLLHEAMDRMEGLFRKAITN